jgi:hypothetical protein
MEKLWLETQEKEDLGDARAGQTFKTSFTTEPPRKQEEKLFLQEVTEKEEIEGYLLSPLPLLPPVQILVFCLLFSPWW